MTKWNRRIELELEPGENILQVKAHNEGLIKSNTPFIEIIDGITIHEGALVLRKGKMKKITIVKI